MTNERAIEILQDFLAWFNDGQPLHWSSTEIGLAIYFADFEIEDKFASTVLNSFRRWLEFGKPFYHSLDHFNDALSIAIETLKANQ